MKYTPNKSEIDVQTLPGYTRVGSFSELPKGTYWFNPITQTMYNSATNTWLEGHVISTGRRWALRTKNRITLQVKLSELDRLIKQMPLATASATPSNNPVKSPKHPYVVIGYKSATDAVTAVSASSLEMANKRANAMIDSGVFSSATVASTVSVVVAPAIR